MKTIVDSTVIQGEDSFSDEPANAKLAESSALLYYLPFADMQSGNMLGLEACCGVHRIGAAASELSGSTISNVAPDMIFDIDEVTMNKAFRDLRNLKNQGFADLRAAVGVSLQQFRDPAFVDKIAAAIKDSGLDPSCLCLQFTENHLVENMLSAEAKLKQLRTLGACLVLDRFGTGFVSMSYLLRNPFDAIKIDASLVEALDTDAEAAATIEAIIAMARSLGLSVYAAGVSTEAQCDFLRSGMCDGLQGNIYSAPVPADRIASFLHAPPRLPEHLCRFQKRARSLLLVDDEINILTALKRLLRRDGYQILQANSGQEGLTLLADKEVDVIVSDQRMPGMTGVEFLREAKKLRPDTVRIVLSGYTELQSITDAINEGAIYKFLTKPWEDERLREHIAEAFKQKEMADENRRLQLEIQEANHKMAAINRRLEDVLKQQREQIASDEASLDVARRILREIPLAIVGLDDQDIVVFANAEAENLFGSGETLFGNDASMLMPGVLEAIKGAECRACVVELRGMRYMVHTHTMGDPAESRGRMLILTSLEGGAHGDRIDH